ncbi:MAG: type VII toxin-antitoxin system HepT family RNase toxin [Promethearchaeia archaeon]
MKIDEDVINSRISKLREYLNILRELKHEPKKDFTEDYKIYGLAERYLHLSIECVLDIGNHIVSRLELKKPEAYQDILIILGKNAILPKEFAEKIAKMEGLRNILIHNYLEINREIVYQHLQEDLSDFDKFLKYIISYLKKRS